MVNSTEETKHGDDAVTELSGMTTVSFTTDSTTASNSTEATTMMTKKIELDKCGNEIKDKKQTKVSDWRRFYTVSQKNPTLSIVT